MERGCLFQPVIEPKPTLPEVWCFPVKCRQSSYLLALGMMCMYMLLHELKAEEVNENVGRTDSSYIYIVNGMLGIVSVPLTFWFIIVATKKQEICFL